MLLVVVVLEVVGSSTAAAVAKGLEPHSRMEPTARSTSSGTSSSSRGLAVAVDCRHRRICSTSAAVASTSSSSRAGKGTAGVVACSSSSRGPRGEEVVAAGGTSAGVGVVTGVGVMGEPGGAWREVAVGAMAAAAGVVGVGVAKGASSSTAADMGRVGVQVAAWGAWGAGVGVCRIVEGGATRVTRGVAALGRMLRRLPATMGGMVGVVAVMAATAAGTCESTRGAVLALCVMLSFDWSWGALEPVLCDACIALVYRGRMVLQWGAAVAWPWIHGYRVQQVASPALHPAQPTARGSNMRGQRAVGTIVSRMYKLLGGCISCCAACKQPFTRRFPLEPTHTRLMHEACDAMRLKVRSPSVVGVVCSS